MATKEGTNEINTSSFENINKISINEPEKESPIFKYISEDGMYFIMLINSSKNKLNFN